MNYSELVKVYSDLEETTKRLKKTAIIAKFLKQARSEEIATIVLLLEGKIFPNWDQSESGIASRLVLKAISVSSGESKEKCEEEWKKTGDLGKAAENLIGKKTQHTLFQTHLSSQKVLANLRKLSTIEGQGSVDHKVQLVAELLTSASSLEAKYIIKTILQELRVGVGEGSLRDAILWAFFGDQLGIEINPEEDEEHIKDREEYKKVLEILQRAYDLTNDFSEVASISKTEGIEGLKKVSITIGNPIKVMLAIKAENVKEGIETVGTPLFAEFKYDGFRTQIHKTKQGEIRIFTRRLEEVTKQFPEVVSYVKDHVKASSFILDCEAVGFDKKAGSYLPFQNISQRIKRKYDIERMAEQFPIELNVFDIMSYDGQNTLDYPFEKRREIIERIVDNLPKKILPSRSIRAESEKEVEKFYKESLKAGNEGVMLKTLSAPYKPGSRVGYMVKLKPVMETLDLVVVGAEWGEGKRSEWLSSYIVACKADDGSLLEVGRVSTGLKEKEEEGLSFKEMTQYLTPLITKEKGKEVEVTPHLVIEVDYEEIQKSPTYASGYALRFPRVKGLREDRGSDDISTIKMVEDLYLKQK